MKNFINGFAPLNGDTLKKNGGINRILIYNTLHPTLAVRAYKYLNLKKSFLYSTIANTAKTIKPSNRIETAGLMTLSILVGSRKFTNLIPAAMDEVYKIDTKLPVRLKTLFIKKNASGNQKNHPTLKGTECNTYPNVASTNPQVAPQNIIVVIFLSIYISPIILHNNI